MIQMVSPIGNIRSHYEDFMREVYRGREAEVLCGPSKASISSGFPVQGGGGASADVDAEGSEGGGEAPAVAASDDDGDSDDGDPDRRGRKASKTRKNHASPDKLSSLTNIRRDGAVNTMTQDPGAPTRINATTPAGALPSPQNPDIALWRLPTVLAHVPVSRSHWWAGVAEGRYPAPVKLSKRCVAWRSADIRALIASF